MAKLGAPYVGVTGFIFPDEVCRLLMWLEYTHQNRLGDRPVMVGVLVNDRTLTGENAEHVSVRFPPMAIMESIFDQASQQGDLITLRLAHYNTHNRDKLGEELRLLSETCGRHMEGVQLNCCWPDPDQIAMAKARFRRIILQVGKRAMEECENNPEMIAKRVAWYEGIATDVLLDPSGGAGRIADFRQLRTMLHAIAESNPSLGLGVAGGLNPENVLTELPRLYREFPNLSVDAEGQLRTQDDHLNTAVTRNYVVNAFEALRLSRVE